MDSNNIMNAVIIVLVLIFVAVLTYFVLARIVAPYSTLHRGVTIIYSQYPNIIGWPPYFQLINVPNQIIRPLANYSLVYGPNTAPIKVVILFNPVMPPGSNFTSLNTNYIIDTSSLGKVQYYILFNVYSFLSSGLSSSPLTVAEINVASVTYCLYNENKTAALQFLEDVGNYVSANITRITNLTSTAFLNQFLSNNGFRINATACINEYEERVMSYQSSVGAILSAYYLPSYVTFTETGQVTINSPILFIIGYNNVTRVSADSINDVNLPLFIQNLETQEFMYEHLSG